MKLEVSEGDHPAMRAIVELENGHVLLGHQFAELELGSKGVKEGGYELLTGCRDVLQLQESMQW